MDWRKCLTADIKQNRCRESERFSTTFELIRMIIIHAILYVLLVVVIFVSLYLSNVYSDYTWFSRFGSLITVIPILISITEFYSDRKAIFYAKHNYARLAPDNVEKLASKYWPTKILINSVITIIGTVIWGFGDLLNKFL